MSSYRVVPQGVSRAMIALVVFGATACSDATGVLEPTAVAVETPAAGIVLSGSGTWTAMPAIGEASEFNCAITIGNYIWVMGGDRELGEMRTIYRYRPNTGTWTEMGSIPVEVPSSWCSIHEVGGKYYYSADVGAPSSGSGRPP